MVRLTQINGEEIVINAELIETIEQAHDTILTLTTTRKVRVKEGLEEIIEKVIEYRRRISAPNLEDRLKA
ncbi:MAG: flagellar FlbD family protein [Bacteroidetes bacterium]|nr:flagellar FlbD family protein [Bacteroidota bacterium]